MGKLRSRIAEAFVNARGSVSDNPTSLNCTQHYCRVSTQSPSIVFAAIDFQKHDKTAHRLPSDSDECPAASADASGRVPPFPSSASGSVCAAAFRLAFRR